MSEFDKEAERERLREKFARDEEKRADTRRMSELLLKGATMTNRHCDTCGDPLFRYDEQEFCPTCQSKEAAATESPESGGAADAPAETPAAEGVENEREDRDGGAASPKPGAESSDEREAADERGETAGYAPRTGPEATSTPPARPGTNGRTPGRAGTSREADTEGDVADARASLVRTLSAHAAAAELASDPRVAADHLTAAREAAETLRALDGR